MVGKGQPPKKPEDKRTLQGVWMSPTEKEKIEKARIVKKQSFSKFVRESALKEADEIIDKK